jgi:hypothetical protein
MGAPNEIDWGGMTLLVKEVKTGHTTGRAATVGSTQAAGGTLTATRTSHLGKTILMDTASGSVVTLPAATGSGDTYRFLVTTTVTSNSHIIKVANATDTMVGVVSVIGAGIALAGDVAGGTDDTISMNGTTTGGIAGTWIECTDVASGKWYVAGVLAASGTPATGQFSATV